MFCGSLNTQSLTLSPANVYFHRTKEHAMFGFFNSKTSKLDGHLISTLADKLLFILLENTDKSCGSKKSRISAVL